MVGELDKEVCLTQYCYINGVDRNCYLSKQIKNILTSKVHMVFLYRIGTKPEFLSSCHVLCLVAYMVGLFVFRWTTPLSMNVFKHESEIKEYYRILEGNI